MQGKIATWKKSIDFLYTPNKHWERDQRHTLIYNSIKDNKMPWNRPNNRCERLPQGKLQIYRQRDWKRHWKGERHPVFMDLKLILWKLLFYQNQPNRNSMQYKLKYQHSHRNRQSILKFTWNQKIPQITKTIPIK